MFCRECGKEIPENADFCPECGTRQGVQGTSENKTGEGGNAFAAEQVENAKNLVKGGMASLKEKKGLVKKVAIAVIAVIAVIIVVSALLNKGVSYIKYNTNDAILISYVDDDMYAYTGSGKVLELDSYSALEYSADRTVMAYIEDGDLYYVKDMKEPVSVEDDVYKFVLSYDGNSIAYMVRDEDSNESELYVYSVSNKKSVEVSTEAYYSSQIVLSQDGTYIAFLGDYDEGESTLYFGKVGGKIEEVEDDAYPAAISGKNQLLYLSDRKLYITSGKEGEKVESYVNNMKLNEDHTEMLFTKDGDLYFYKIGEKDATKIMKNAGLVKVWGPEGIIVHTTFMTNTFGVSSFKGAIIETDSGYYKINKSGTDAIEILDDYSYGVFSDDMKSFVGLDGSKIELVKDIDSKKEAKELITEKNLEDLVADKDLKNFYIMNDDNELSYIKQSMFGKAKLVEITDDASSMLYCDDMKAVVYMEDGDLYYAKKNSKSAKQIAEDVSDYWISYGKLYYQITDDGDTEFYSVSSSGKSKLLN